MEGYVLLGGNPNTVSTYPSMLTTMVESSIIWSSLSHPIFRYRTCTMEGVNERWALSEYDNAHARTDARTEQSERSGRTVKRTGRFRAAGEPVKGERTRGVAAMHINTVRIKTIGASPIFSPNRQIVPCPSQI